MASYNPQPSLRERAINPSKTCLLLVDIQNYNCSKQGALYAHLSEEQLAEDYSYFFNRVPDLRPKWQALLTAARAARLEVVHTVIQQLTRDGRDRGRDYKLSGFCVPPGCWDAQVLMTAVDGVAAA
jgi:nicotinamidase-related amidase